MVVHLPPSGLTQGTTSGLVAGPDPEQARCATHRAQPAERNPIGAKVRELKAKTARLEKDLRTAHTTLEIQGKVA